jgi:hypothetical protein
MLCFCTEKENGECINILDVAIGQTEKKGEYIIDIAAEGWL